MIPEKIIVETYDGEFIVAELDHSKQIENSDGQYIYYYKFKEIYHILEDAIKNEF